MKTSFVNKLLLIILPLFTTQVFAHSGHLTNETVHGLLHIEHIIGLAALGIVAYMVDVYRNKR